MRMHVQVVTPALAAAPLLTGHWHTGTLQVTVTVSNERAQQEPQSKRPRRSKKTGEREGSFEDQPRFPPHRYDIKLDGSIGHGSGVRVQVRVRAPARIMVLISMGVG